MSTAPVTTRIEGRYAGERRIRQRTARITTATASTSPAGTSVQTFVRRSPSTSAAASMSRTARYAKMNETAMPTHMSAERRVNRLIPTRAYPAADAASLRVERPPSYRASRKGAERS